eukprot:scaffold2313_cov100-Isochrysis_galbana.AAC.3
MCAAGRAPGRAYLAIEVAGLEADVGAVRQGAGQLQKGRQAAHALPVEFNHLGEQPPGGSANSMERFLPIPGIGL